MESVCSTKLRVFAAKFEGLTWSTSRGLAWDIPVLYRKMLIQNWVCLPRPKRDLDTRTTYGPQTWHRGLYAQWSIHPPSLVISMPCEARTRGGSKLLCAKSTFFFRCPGRLWNRTERSQSLVWVSTPQRGKPVLFYVFRQTIMGSENSKQNSFSPLWC